MMRGSCPRCRRLVSRCSRLRGAIRRWTDAEDLLREQEVWLVDESLETSAQIGAVLGTRLARPDSFAITCGC